MKKSALGLSRTVFTAVIVACAALLLTTLFAAVGSERLGYDFRTYLVAAEEVRVGESPYASPESDLVVDGKAYVYPPPLAIALVPLTFLSTDLAAALGFLAALAALVGTLLVLGVRDVRCHAALIASSPAWNALEMANLSALLPLGLAVAWRLRETLWPFAAVVGLTVAVKLFVWPVLVWSAATGRLRASVLSGATAVALLVVTWAAIGFVGLTSYPALLRALADVHAVDSYSLIAIADTLGFGVPVGRVAMLLLGGALLAACVTLGRRGDDRQALTCAVGAALALTPILWQHHLLLLVVPLALARPRFTMAWLLPITLWLSPRAGNGEALQTLLPALIVAAVIYVCLARPRITAVPASAT